MRVLRHLLIAVRVIGNWRSIKQNHVPVVDAEIVIQHASYDPVARAQALNPDGLFNTGIIGTRCAFGQRPLRKPDFALGIASLWQLESTHLDFLAESLPNLQCQRTFARTRRANPEVPLVRLRVLAEQIFSGLISEHPLAETAAGFVEEAQIIVAARIARIKLDESSAG